MEKYINYAHCVGRIREVGQYNGQDWTDFVELLQTKKYSQMTERKLIEEKSRVVQELDRIRNILYEEKGRNDRIEKVCFLHQKKRDDELIGGLLYIGNWIKVYEKERDFVQWYAITFGKIRNRESIIKGLLIAQSRSC